MRDLRDQVYYLQNPRPMFTNPSDYIEALLIFVDLALDLKDKTWFYELTDRIIEIKEDLLRTGQLQ
jgi:hypothetical protein